MDYVGILLLIPPEYEVADVVGYLKGKSAIEIANHCETVRKRMEANFWAGGG